MADDMLHDEFDSPEFGANEGPVYYDPAAHRFTQLRGVTGKNLVLSDLCEYFADAQTSIDERRLPPEYLDRLQNADPVDQLKEAEHDGIDWRVRKDLEPARLAT